MEKWAKVNGFEGYEVSDMGRIKSLDRVVKTKKGSRKIEGKMLRLTLQPHGYLTVDLCVNNTHNQRRVNRLIAEIFIPNPDNKPQVNHINGVKIDNRVSNLEWATSKENNVHAFNSGLNSNEAKRKAIVCSNKMVFESSYKAAEWLNITFFSGNKLVKNLASKIRCACNGYQKIAYGFSWSNKLD